MTVLVRVIRPIVIVHVEPPAFDKKQTRFHTLFGERSMGQMSGVRESNPPSWLGKPEHYHYANPACPERAQRVEGPFGTQAARIITGLRLTFDSGCRRRRHYRKVCDRCRFCRAGL